MPLDTREIFEDVAPKDSVVLRYMIHKFEIMQKQAAEQEWERLHNASTHCLNYMRKQLADLEKS